MPSSGPVEVKNKGAIDMYFVDRIKEAYCKDEHGRVPNETMRRELERLRGSIH
jgi:hypothetical protein